MAEQAVAAPDKLVETARRMTAPRGPRGAPSPAEQAELGEAQRAMPDVRALPPDQRVNVEKTAAPAPGLDGVADTWAQAAPGVNVGTTAEHVGLPPRAGANVRRGRFASAVLSAQAILAGKDAAPDVGDTSDLVPETWHCKSKRMKGPTLPIIQETRDRDNRPINRAVFVRFAKGTNLYTTPHFEDVMEDQLRWLVDQGVMDPDKARPAAERQAAFIIRLIKRTLREPVGVLAGELELFTEAQSNKALVDGNALAERIEAAGGDASGLRASLATLPGVPKRQGPNIQHIMTPDMQKEQEAAELARKLAPSLGDGTPRTVAAAP